MADLFVDQSPYHFGYNNPISFVDPTGLHNVPARPTEAIGKGGYLEMIDDYDGWAIVIEVTQPNLPIPDHVVEFIDHSGGYGGGTGNGHGGGGGGGGGGPSRGNPSPRGASNNSSASDFSDTKDLVGNAGTATSIIEQGAERGQRLYSKEALNNPNAAKNALKSANLAKWMSRVGTAANVVTLGYEAYNTLTNPNATNADYAKIGAKIGVVLLEGALNGVAPGLGIVVGIGLNYAIDKYGDNVYNSIINSYNRLAL